MDDKPIINKNNMLIAWSISVALYAIVISVLPSKHSYAAFWGFMAAYIPIWGFVIYLIKKQNK